MSTPIAAGVDRNALADRLDHVGHSIDDTFWTAKEWARRTRFPYRTILAAAARGELEAVRPSGTASGVILISEAAWSTWMKQIRLKVGVPERVPDRLRPQRRSLDELAMR
jgi:hypothetical protein